jgi:hypothetical protein
LLSRQDKEKLVLDLYNQGKTYREIAQELRISPRDIGFTLRKAAAEEGGEEKEYTDKNTQQEQQLSISSQAYKLFYTGKGPIDVAIELNLPEQQVTKLHKQYCKLREINSLNMIYEDIGDKHFMSILRLYLDIKSKGISIEQLGNALEIVDKLPDLEKRFEYLQNEIRTFEDQKQRSISDLQISNTRIAASKRLFDWYQIHIDREKTELQDLKDVKNRLESFVTRFKISNEEYLKIKQIMEEKVNSIMTTEQHRMLLRLAVTAVIEAFRNELNNNNNNGQHLLASNNIPRILEIASQLYNRMVIDWVYKSTMSVALSTLNSS